MTRRSRRGGPGGLSADHLREQRLESIRLLAERFVFDLGRLVAGHPALLEDHLAAGAAARLRAAVEPFLASGDAMRPNFGEYGELRVEGDLLALESPVTAEVDFEDQSARETAGGELLPARRRRLRLTLLVAADLGSINDFRMRPLADPVRSG